MKCEGTRAEIRFRFSAKRTSPFKLAGTSVPSTTGSRGVCISGSNAPALLPHYYTMFRGSVKSTGYSLHSPVSLSFTLPCVTVCHHVSTGLYHVLCISRSIIMHHTETGLRRDAHEFCRLLGLYAAYNGSSISPFQYNLACLFLQHGTDRLS